MNQNIKDLEIEKGLTELNLLTESTKAMKCTRCKTRRPESDFNRNGRSVKTCNVCDNIRTSKISKKTVKTEPAKDEIEKIITKPELAGKLTDETLNELINDKPKVDIKKANSEDLLNKLLNENLIELQKINEMEMFLHMTATSEAEYSTKSPQEKINYQRTVIDLFTKKLQSTNPLVWMILMGSGIVEKNTHYLQYAGIDLDLEGYQKELETHKKELNDICNDVIVDAPQIVKFLNNPYLKLSIVLSAAGFECHKRNTEKKNQLGSSKQNQ